MSPILRIVERACWPVSIELKALQNVVQESYDYTGSSL